jgi:hypothetical protein
VIGSRGSREIITEELICRNKVKLESSRTWILWRKQGELLIVISNLVTWIL